MTLREAFEQKMMLLDGGMGSVIQTYGIKGANNDMLSIERPDVILDIQRRYVDAGVDCLTTNTFSSQRVSQHEYHQESRIAEMNRASVAIAKQAAAEAMEKYGRKVFILGDVGPTSKMLSMSDDVNDPASRSITFDELEDAYLEQIQVLMNEGVDGILIETIFDTLNAKAALSAYSKVKGGDVERFKNVEVMLSMTVSDASGRTLSGQTVEAFAISVVHAKPLSIGLNCGLGADGMIPYLRRMGKVAPCYISCHPNAGLPNQFGGYDDTPDDMVRLMTPYMDEHLVNMIGGCCGTTPEHIAAMRKMLDALPADYERRKPAPAFVTSPLLRLAGLEPLLVNQVRPSNGAESCNAEDFVRVGERCNVAGSKKFLRLVNEKNYDEALDIARKQVEDGALVIDVNMDDGLLDAKQEMRTFLNLLASDPAISRVPIMVDSSRFEVIEEGLKCAQGKCIVNSISLKMGEEAFIEHALTVKRLGAAVIVMLFDEEGQATNYDRRVQIASRAYKLITEKCGFDPSDIIFDPNVLTVATGMAEHNAYAHDFIRACRWIIDNLPGVRISGGLSNLSFAFRGNNYLRESMHSAFLHLATPNGMGMAIMNPAAEVAYKTIPMELRLAINEVLLNTEPDASETLIEIASRMNEAAAKAKETGAKYDPTAIFAVSAGSANVAGSTEAGAAAGNAAAVQTTPEQRLQEALLKGTSTTLQPDLMELINRGDSPVNIISGPLMDGMNEVGRLFGEGKMFLPQVVKTARTMKKAVEILQPYIEAGKAADSANGAAASRGKIVIATVKGDVHDIGKNIVSVIMACNGFDMVDLGVMVPEDVIVQAAIEHKADIVSLSGLITPSLEEMCTVAKCMQEAGLRIPIIVGGATTSPTHTAVKIAPCYDGPVFHVRDAASNPGLAQKLLDPASSAETVEENRKEQQRIRDEQFGKVAAKAEAMAAAESSPQERRFKCDWSKYSPVQPPFMGECKLSPIPLEKVIPLISWEYFFFTWKVKPDCDEAKKLHADAETLLADLNKPEYSLRAVQAFYPAAGSEEAVVFNTNRTGTDADLVEVSTARQQNPEGTCLALCDYVAPADAKTASVYSCVAGDKLFRDIVGAFAVTVSETFVRRLEKLKAEQGGSDYDVLLMQTVADRLAEAGAEYLSQQLAANCGWNGIRPAVGYPVLPNIKEIFNVAKLIDFDSVGISLTENGAMYPQASVSGLYISHPEIEYFNVKA